MKPIGIVICNYNKRDFVLDCIRSVKESRVQNFDIYMVDNASTDGSVEAVRQEFGDAVTILQNDENLGGSGGFNTGLRVVRDKGYEYFVCLDDDVQVDENAIQALYEYMEANPEVGMAGSRVYHMQMPDYIQQCGLLIDFEHCSAKTLYADQLEDGTLPEVIECDTVATCSVMIRGSVVRETDAGIMPEDNFIYWDDMEWGHRIRMAGYRIVTLAASKVLHQMGANVKKPNTFLDYYMWRNRTNFFMRYTPEEMLEEMSVQALGSIFDAMYESMFREEHNVMQSISYAYHDALAGVRGKAADYKILKNDANDDKLTAYVKQKKTYAILSGGQEEDVMYLRNFLHSVNPELTETEQREQADMVFHLCPYIFQVKEIPENEIMIDSDRNCIITEDDVVALQNYEYSKLLFIYMNQGAFLAAARRMRQKGEKNE
ncbi:MAG: glycosyltransferase family 2 protein [Lachnospiraceae bacterium]|nr:glycosyltransferase family 2 protein [Lachnospiraceae bacterium]